MRTLDTVSRRTLVVTEGVPVETNLYGLVHDTKGNPLPAVSVRLNGRATTTATDGTFSFLLIEPGSYTVICTKEGYQNFARPITLTEGENDIDIEMLAEGEALPTPKYWPWVAVGAGIVAIGGIAYVATRKKK